MIKYTIFIVDDDESVLTGLSMSLDDKYVVHGFSMAEEALATATNLIPDLVLLDIGLPGMSGTKALKEFRKIKPNILVVMITAFEDIETVVSCMQSGAYDYVVKPINMDTLENSIANALESIRLRKEVQLLQEKYLQENLPCFIGESDGIHEVMDFVEMAAQSQDTPVMILGESGTGKEYVAAAIHYKSPNFKGPFVSINCAAIPANLIESELFGYEEGAFSGARTSGKTGLVEASVGGTLFLDEIGDMPMEVQAKLLRFLEEGEFYKLGSVKKSKIKTRIVSATNKNIGQMINEETFRKDLYFRLGVVTIRIPSLNERKTDILPLAKFFMETYSQKFRKPLTGLSKEVKELLLKYSWSGNVRELRNLMERGVLASKERELQTRDLGIDPILPGQIMDPQKNSLEFPDLLPAGLDLDGLHTAMDEFYFTKALEMAGGKETKAAQLLNLNYHTFRNRKKKYINPPS